MRTNFCDEDLVHLATLERLAPSVVLDKDIRRLQTYIDLGTGLTPRQTSLHRAFARRVQDLCESQKHD